MPNNIQDTFIVRLPIDPIEPYLRVDSEDEDQDVAPGDEFSVGFSYQLGLPKLDANTPFTVAYTSTPNGYTPSGDRFTPTAPQHDVPVDPNDASKGRRTIPPDEALTGTLDSNAPNLTGSEAADLDEVVITGTITAVQPDA